MVVLSLPMSVQVGAGVGGAYPAALRRYFAVLPESLFSPRHMPYACVHSGPLLFMPIPEQDDAIPGPSTSTPWTCTRPRPPRSKWLAARCPRTGIGRTTRRFPWKCLPGPLTGGRPSRRPPAPSARGWRRTGSWSSSFPTAARSSTSRCSRSRPTPGKASRQGDREAA